MHQEWVAFLVTLPSAKDVAAAPAAPAVPAAPAAPAVPVAAPAVRFHAKF